MGLSRYADTTHHHVRLHSLKGILDEVHAGAVVYVFDDVPVGEVVCNAAYEPLGAFWGNVHCHQPEGPLWRLGLV